MALQAGEAVTKVTSLLLRTMKNRRNPIMQRDKPGASLQHNREKQRTNHQTGTGALIMQRGKLKTGKKKAPELWCFFLLVN
jgi:hypothetical protein